MKLILITGPQAVGKMTVGQKLTEITKLHLMHNHQMIEPVLEIFKDFNVPTILELRNVIFNNFLKTNNYGLIFTMCMDYNSEFNWKITNELINMYKNAGADVYYIELIASKETRLKRNITENRLACKKSKQDTKRSSEMIEYEDIGNQRFESYDGEVKLEHYIKINNENLSAEEVAKIIKDKFNL